MIQIAKLSLSPAVIQEGTESIVFSAWRRRKREDKEDEDDEDDDVSHVDEEDVLGVQREDRRGGDGQINEQVEKLRRPEGASNETERD